MTCRYPISRSLFVHSSTEKDKKETKEPMTQESSFHFVPELHLTEGLLIFKSHSSLLRSETEKLSLESSSLVSENYCLRGFS